MLRMVELKWTVSIIFRNKEIRPILYS